KIQAGKTEIKTDKQGDYIRRVTLSTTMVSQYLEKEYSGLEKTTKKPREYHVKEALTRYMKDTEEVKETEKYRKRKKLPHEYHI
ncbi:828_t:CDS:2, partial [Racocetra persica]